jgi:hypothetical protein
MAQLEMPVKAKQPLHTIPSLPQAQAHPRLRPRFLEIQAFLEMQALLLGVGLYQVVAAT